MSQWIETRLVDYPTHVVSGRFGASVMFVAFDRLLKQWVWVQPGGVEEKIAEPTHIFVDEQWAREHLLETPRPKLHTSTRIHRGKSDQQLALEL
jgi:hypothetical protein